MHRFVRTILVISGVLMLILAAGFAFRLGWAQRIWMWSDSPLSFYFIASMQAAIAAAMLWVGLSGELRALAPGALNLVVMMAGSALTFILLAARDPQLTYFGYAIGCALFAAFNVWLFFWAQRIPFLDERPLPWVLRISYVIFILVLATVGVALLYGVQDVLPWRFTIGEATNPENSNTPVLFGWMFFGDAFYFLYALFYPRWHAARAQLWSFLAYDLVLIGPFLIRMPFAWPNFFSQQPLPNALLDNLYVYTAILVYSGVLGIYYLLINKHTRRNSTAASSEADIYALVRDV
jgi:hypothetical protein